MPDIQLLSQATIDQIAAGEAVEKPASVVKELAENAIDAKATAITIEIKEGGIAMIRITDNGCGIPKEQIKLAFLRHSTSKIRTVEDLSSISSLGFRGEALSSVSAVAQVELITKTADSFIGVHYEIEGGAEKKLEEVGAPDGTTLIVRNLFYNTPARKKFLKTAVTEGNYIQDLVERLALSHPNISFKFINNNQMKLHTSGNSNLKDVIYQIYGRDIASHLIEVSFQSERANISGFIGKPAVARGNRQFENYFVNGRYVKSAIISKGIEQAYKNFLMQHKYPFTALLAEFDGNYLDVNVHPTKMEIRFSDGEKVYQLFYHVLHEALMQREMIQEIALSEQKSKQNATSAQKQQEEKARSERQTEPPIEKSPETLIKKSPEKPPKAPEPFEKNRIRQEKERILKEQEKKLEKEHTEGKKQGFNEERPKQERQLLRETPHYHVNQQLSLFEEQLVERKVEDEIQIIGQVFETYWILQFEDKMYLIDQHAAHEKVLYERLLKKIKDRECSSQMISPPLIISVSAEEAQMLETYREQLAQIGYEIEPFGGKEYAIHAVPADLLGLNERDLFLELLDDLCSEAGKTKPEMMLDKIASMSCKAAVKGNQKLSEAETKALLYELMQLENPYHCPHGRPVIVAITKQEMEKMFKRIV